MNVRSFLWVIDRKMNTVEKNFEIRNIFSETFFLLVTLSFTKYQTVIKTWRILQCYHIYHNRFLVNYLILLRSLNCFENLSIKNLLELI